MATVGEETRRDYAHVPVYSCYPLVRTRLEELAADELFEGEHDAIFALDTNRRAAVFYCLDRVFDLKVATVGREDRVGQVVACAY